MFQMPKNFSMDEQFIPNLERVQTQMLKRKINFLFQLSVSAHLLIYYTLFSTICFDKSNFLPLTLTQHPLSSSLMPPPHQANHLITPRHTSTTLKIYQMSFLSLSFSLSQIDLLSPLLSLSQAPLLSCPPLSSMVAVDYGGVDGCSIFFRCGSLSMVICCGLAFLGYEWWLLGFLGVDLHLWWWIQVARLWIEFSKL